MEHGEKLSILTVLRNGLSLLKRWFNMVDVGDRVIVKEGKYGYTNATPVVGDKVGVSDYGMHGGSYSVGDKVIVTQGKEKFLGIKSGGCIDIYDINVAFIKPPEWYGQISVDGNYPLRVKYSPNGIPYVAFVVTFGSTGQYRGTLFSRLVNETWEHAPQFSMTSRVPYQVGIDIDADENLWICNIEDPSTHLEVVKYVWGGSSYTRTLVARINVTGYANDWINSTHMHLVNPATSRYIISSMCNVYKRIQHIFMNHPVYGNFGQPFTGSAWNSLSHGEVLPKYVYSTTLVDGPSDRYDKCLLTIFAAKGLTNTGFGAIFSQGSNTVYTGDLRNSIKPGVRAYLTGDDPSNARYVWVIDDYYMFLNSQYPGAGGSGNMSFTDSYIIHQVDTNGLASLTPVGSWETPVGTQTESLPTDGSLIRSCVVVPSGVGNEREDRCIFMEYEKSLYTPPIPTMNIVGCRLLLYEDGYVYQKRPVYGNPLQFIWQVPCEQKILPLAGDKSGFPPENQTAIYPCARFSFAGYANNLTSYGVGNNLWYEYPHPTDSELSGYRGDIVPDGEGVALDFDTWYNPVDKSLHGTAAWVKDGKVYARAFRITPCFNKYCGRGD